jgi:hypothetical protein
MPRRGTAYIKPRKFADYLTLSELSERVDKNPRWLRRLEADGRIPKAVRISWGKLRVRLWSPAQVEEIEEIISTHRVGRPSGG